MKTELDLNSLGRRDLLNALPDGAYITDRERHIVFWNAAAERITGWTSGDVVGRRCADNILVHVDKDGHQLCGEAYCPLHRSMITGRASRASQLIYAQSKSGARVPVEVTVAPLRGEDGEVVGGIEVFRDSSAMIGDLNRARVIQVISVEPDLPADDRLAIASCYAPHDLVGGDFFHVERIDDDRYAILVADVMGHGVAAALYTMQLRSLWEEFRPLLARPGEFLAALNGRLLVLTEGGDHFATAVHLVVDAAAGTVDYALAGHESPIFSAGTGGDRRGPCLGLIAEVDFPLVRSRLERGDDLLLFTDGAIEVTHADGRELGRAGLRQFLAECSGAPGPAVDRLEKRIVDYNRAVHLEDDLTLVLVHRN